MNKQLTALADTYRQAGDAIHDAIRESIQAHGGSVICIDGTYYWYGENKEKTDGKNAIWH